MHNRHARIQATLALHRQKHDYRGRATSKHARANLWEGLRMAVNQQLKRESGDKADPDDVDRATKEQLDRIEALNASWEEKIQKKFHQIDLDP